MKLRWFVIPVAVANWGVGSPVHAQAVPLPHSPSSEVLIPVPRDFLSAQGPGSDFGVCVARGRDSLGRDIVVVGADKEEQPGDVGVNYGSVHVFLRAGPTWEPWQVLLPSDRQPLDNFGRRVDIDDDTIVVGAHMYDRFAAGTPGPGRAYVFQLDPMSGLWEEVAILENPLSPSSADGSLFGCSAAVEGDLVVVGATFADNLTGRAWVFESTSPGWSTFSTTELSPPGLMTGDFFGHAAAMDGDRIAVSATTALCQSTGKVIVWRKSAGAWVVEDVVLPPVGMQGGGFGYGLALDQNSMFVGAACNDGGACACEFNPLTSRWDCSNLSFDPPGGVLGELGWDMSVDGHLAVVSARHFQIGGQTDGGVYVFSKGSAGWTQQERLVLPPAPHDWKDFGVSTHLSGHTLVVGANGWQSPPGSGVQFGAAYIYSLLKVR